MSNYEKCKSCKFYKTHFIEMGTMFNPIDGHCVNSELIKHRKQNPYRLEENCEHWEINTEERKAKVESIRRAIFDICEHLRHIESMLKYELGNAEWEEYPTSGEVCSDN